MNRKETGMKRLAKHLAAVMMAVMLVVPMFTVVSSAASNVAITGGDNAAGGETFTVTVTYSGDNVGRVSAGMTYDPSMLTYISGGSGGGGGWIQMKNAGTGEDITFDIKFQAVKEGTTSVSVSTREIYDLAEMEMELPAAASKDIVISGNAAEDQLLDEEQPSIEEGDGQPGMIGVDEKENTLNTTMILAIGAIVIAILIVVIAIIIKKRK